MSKVAVHDVDHFVEGALIRERLPTVAVIEREAVLASSEWCKSEALIWTDLVDSAQNEVAATNFDREAARGFALIQQRLDGRHDGREPGRIWTTPSWGHGRQCATAHEVGRKRPKLAVFQSTETYRDHPVAGYGRRPGGTSAHAWTRRLNRVDAHGMQPVDRLGAGWHDATTSGASSATDPGQRRRVGKPRTGSARAHEPHHGPSLAEPASWPSAALDSTIARAVADQRSSPRPRVPWSWRWRANCPPSATCR